MGRYFSKEFRCIGECALGVRSKDGQEVVTLKIGQILLLTRGRILQGAWPEVPFGSIDQCHGDRVRWTQPASSIPDAISTLLDVSEVRFADGSVWRFSSESEFVARVSKHWASR